MPRALRPLSSLSLLLLLAPAMAQAGWIIEWSTSAANNKGANMASEAATQSIAGNRVRLEQPHIVTLVDYGQDRFTLINPNKQYFWSGTTDQYVLEMKAARAKGMQDKMGDIKGMMGGDKAAKAKKDPGSPAVDPATLPPVSVSATGTTETIAGYEAVKYEVRVGGDLYEEVWIAPLDVSADLDGARFMAQQQKLAAARSGKSAAAGNAVYRTPEYAKLFEKGLALKTVSHHASGTFERKATAVKQAEVSAAAFEVPESYRKVRLSDLLDPPPTPAPSAPGK